MVNMNEERIKAIDSLVAACIKRGQLIEAQAAAKLAGRDFSTEEINKLVRAFS